MNDQWWDHQIKQLQQYNFLLPDESRTDIRTDFYNRPLWAEIFWQRRHSHQRRSDPEVDHIIARNPKTILEIGTAYGRVAAKILEKIQAKGSTPPQMTGIELCTDLEPYFKQYQQIHPVLERMNYINGDMFTWETTQQFDMIVFPMSTLPSLSISALEQLLKIISTRLNPDGCFIFTIYKTPDKIELLKKNLQLGKVKGEILFNDSMTTINTTEFIRNSVEELKYGLLSHNFMTINQLDRQYGLQNREIFYMHHQFFSEDGIKSILDQNGFDIIIWDDSSHSLVIGTVPR